MTNIKIYTEKLRKSGLRQTRQRLKICEVLFSTEKTFHFTINDLAKIIEEKLSEKISLATVYNTLHNLTNLGFLRQVKVNSSQNYFDTNITAHHHFFDQSNNSLIDIDKDTIKIQGIPTPPDKKKISEVEFIISIKNI